MSRRAAFDCVLAPAALLALAALISFVISGCRSGAEVDHLKNLMQWSNFFYSQAADPALKRHEAVGAYARSQRLAKMYLEKEPNNIMARTILGYTQLMLGPWMSSNPNEDTAESTFRLVLDRQPGNYRAHMGLGMVYFQVSRKLDRGRLDDFSRALQAVRMMKDLLGDLYEVEVSNPHRAAELDEQIAIMFHGFARDMRHFADGATFPWRRYKGLVPPEDVAGTNPEPPESLVREAIRTRVEQLLGAMETAQQRLPPDHALFSANLDRLEILLRIAYDHFREQFVARLDQALHHFRICERLHERDNLVYHWIFEYMALTYMLKASVFERGEPSPVETTGPVALSTGTAANVSGQSEPDEPSVRRVLMNHAMHYFREFYRHDRAFEQRRLERLHDPGIDQLRKDEFWTHELEAEMVIEDFRALMRELIDEARRHRQVVLQMMIDLNLHEFATPDSFRDVLELCDLLFDAEVMLNDPRDIGQQPVKHYFFRAEARRYLANRMEEGFARDEFGEPVLPTEGELHEEHRSLWQQAYRDYRQFLSRASVRDFAEMRDISRESIAACTVRYPEIVEENSTAASR